MNKPLAVHYEIEGETRCKAIHTPNQQRTTQLHSVTCKRCLGLIQGHASQFNNRYNSVRFTKPNPGKQNP